MKTARHLIFAMLLIVLLSATGTAAHAAQGADGDFDAVPYYGRQALSELDNSDALLYAYDQLVAGVEGCTETIDVVRDGDTISLDEIKIVYDAYIRDHAEHFWLGNAYSMWGSEESVVSISPSYTMSGNELTQAKVAFEQAADAMLEGITADMSEFERELTVHNRLGAAVVYVEGPNAHNAYGALVEGYSVCEGYAEAFQYLLRRVGIQSFLIQGTGINTQGQTEAHEWNAVRIDGKFYHVDLTWDDQGANLFHAYFNLSTSDMTQDHWIEPAGYALPVCDSTDANYFEVMGGRLETYDVETVAAALKQNDYLAEFYLPGDNGLNSFWDWAVQHGSDLMGELGIRSAAYGYQSVGRGLVFLFGPSNDAHNLQRGIWYMTQPATCTEKGTETRVCGSCGEVETRDIAPKGHRFGDWTETVKPTCAKPGTEQRICLTCGHSETRDVEAPNHQYENAVTKPTCTDEGYTTHTCVCGDSYVDTFVPATGHTMENTVEDHKAYRACTDCAHREETDSLQAEDGHVSITLDDCPEQTEIFVAVYDQNGRMKGLQRVTVTDHHAEFTLDGCGQTDLARAFFLGGAHTPWLSGMDITFP